MSGADGAHEGAHLTPAQTDEAPQLLTGKAAA
jgi:hypothetical protein